MLTSRYEPGAIGEPLRTAWWRTIIQEVRTRETGQLVRDAPNLHLPPLEFRDVVE